MYKYELNASSQLNRMKIFYSRESYACIMCGTHCGCMNIRIHSHTHTRKDIIKLFLTKKKLSSKQRRVCMLLSCSVFLKAPIRDNTWFRQHGCCWWSSASNVTSSSAYVFVCVHLWSPPKKEITKIHPQEKCI